MTASENTAAASSTPAAHKELPRKLILRIAGVVVAIVLVYVGYRHLTFVTTDDAQIQANTILIAPKVSGFILKVNVDENQRVKAGEVLAEVDSRDYENAVIQMENEEASTEAKARDAEKNFRRMKDLIAREAVSQSQFDTAESNYRDTTGKLRAQQALLDQAKLNLAYTKIVAPANGVIARKSAQVGMLVAQGTPLFGFVSSEERWVTANFKETEIEGIKVGRSADVSVDAISGKTYHGTVESMSPATGATFTLLPPDNATGNFTKVVQRVPVRIKFQDLSAADIDELQAGLSADVSVRIR